MQQAAVAASLRRRRLSVAPSVGIGAGTIDLVVSHPREPDRGLLGIECETERGRHPDSVADRYRLRPAVLADRGWALHRVWAHEWSRGREQEISRIADRVEELFTRSTGGVRQL